MYERKGDKKIALWKLEHGYAEADSPDSMTRAEIMAKLQRKELLRKKLSMEYLETFGENYQGDILEDVVMDRRSRKELEKLAGYLPQDSQKENKCHCPTSTCAKCLSTGCKVDNCPTHSNYKKESWRRRWEIANNKPWSTD